MLLHNRQRRCPPAAHRSAQHHCSPARRSPHCTPSLLARSLLTAAPLCPSTPRPTAALVHSWVRPAGEGKLRSALAELEALHLLARAAGGGAAAWALHPGFQAQLRSVLSRGCGQAGEGW